ncbi:MAG TPA: sugar phosphate isomerase/epimerase, partial [Candidatus Faecaligallichristensenella faecipullorum]|nr:sugar phosphate isomerase/epimerase [Candidatus Faecaligallichristensenella faecipullorum]
HGAVPVEQCLRILKNAGYNGYINVEFEGMEENLPAIKAGYRYLKNLI